MDQDQAVSLAINIVTMRHQTLLRAVSALVRILPDEAKRAFAADIRVQVGELMQDAAELMHPDMDSLVTLDLATLLEAAGQPPTD